MLNKIDALKRTYSPSGDHALPSKRKRTNCCNELQLCFILSITLRLVFVSKCLLISVLGNPYNRKPTQRLQTRLKILNSDCFPTCEKPNTFWEAMEAAMVLFVNLGKVFSPLRNVTFRYFKDI